MVKQLIGEDFQGVLGSDFYAGYNSHQGLHQRCWVHFLRDIHDLKKQFPQDETLFQLGQKDQSDLRRGGRLGRIQPRSAPISTPATAARVAQQHAFEQQLWALCQPFVRTSAPQHTLCERVERFLPELFVFVAVPGVPAHNNLAERSVRPLVIARKISGGLAAPKVHRPVWGWPASLAPG